MRKGQEMSIEVLVVMALALLLVTIWYFGQGAMGDAIKKNLEEGKCISAVNIAVIASAGHEEGTVEATWYKTITELVTSSFTVKRADLEYEGLCCVELEEDKSKRAKKDTLILISQKVNTTCSLGRRLKDTSMLDESTPFCFISKLPVLPDADISKENSLHLMRWAA